VTYLLAIEFAGKRLKEAENGPVGGGLKTLLPIGEGKRRT
jgi:hypothetical protein